MLYNIPKLMRYCKSSSKVKFQWSVATLKKEKPQIKTLVTNFPRN